MKEKPDAVFVAGDLYDGTAIDAAQAAERCVVCARPRDVLLCGNHEQSETIRGFLRAVTGAGVHILHNEKVEATICRSWACPTTTHP